jgi:CHAT domain-containing protein
MDDSRTQTYRNLIQVLLTCPSGEEPQILQDNSELLDQGFLQLCKVVAENLAEEGQENQADFLRALASQLGDFFGMNQGGNSDYLAFLKQLLKTVSDSQGNPQQVYPFLQQNLDKLDLQLVQILTAWAKDTFAKVEATQANYIAAVIVTLGNLIGQFPLGSRLVNLEIAIACYLQALEVYTRADFPEDWAMTQNNLATAYSDKITGNRAENIDRAIACYLQALEVRTRADFPENWAMTQNNLATAYYDRIRGEKAENIEIAIASYIAALEVYTREAFPEQWATTQNNLATAYLNRIRGERADNIERAIASYIAALEVRTREAFPQDWAQTQNNLANAYTNRIRGDKADNIEYAIASYCNALTVYTREAFPQDWAMTQNNLATAYSKRIRGEKFENIEYAIAFYTPALEVRTREAFPQDWAQTQNNLANAYSDRIRGEKTENIENAITSYTAALEVYTRNAFPQNHAETLLNLGLAYQKVPDLSKAYDTFTDAINTVEFLRGEIYSGNESKQKLAEEWNSLYHQMVEVCLDLGNYSDALEYVERSKARNLVDLLATRDLYPKVEIPKTVLTELQRLRQEIAVENRRQAAEPTPDNTLVNQLRQRWNELSPFKPIQFNQIQNLIDDNTAILEWYITDDRFQAFIITRQSEHPIVWRSSPKDREALRDWASEYLNDYSQEKYEWRQQLASRLQRLADVLHLDEILLHISPTCNQLILIPHRFLHLFPLHALLLDRFPGGVRYAPSCHLLQFTQKHQRQDFNNLFAIQNPTSDLNFTDIEVETISQYFPQAYVLSKASATKEAIDKEQLRTANYVHFSGHSYFNFQSPLESALILAEALILADKPLLERLRGKGDFTLDLSKCLTLREIFDLDLGQCRLVTLSACDTGLTDFTSISDEYIGFAAAFLCAGSSSVVVSLWEPNDLSTAFLMIKFYQNLQTSISVAIALNQAQIWLRDITQEELLSWLDNLYLSKGESHRGMNRGMKKALSLYERDEKPFDQPFYWAAFCAVGQ